MMYGPRQSHDPYVIVCCPSETKTLSLVITVSLVTQYLIKSRLLSRHVIL